MSFDDHHTEHKKTQIGWLIKLFKSRYVDTEITQKIPFNIKQPFSQKISQDKHP